MKKEEKTLFCLKNGLSLEEAEKSWYVNTDGSEKVFNNILKKLNDSLG